MANPPTFPSDGRITSLQNYTAAFTGGELFPIVAPGNATAGINYNITASTIAQNLLPVLPAQATNSVFWSGGGAPSFTTSPTIGTSIIVPAIYGGTKSTSALNLFATNSSAPNTDVVNVFGNALFFYPDKVPGNLNNASLSFGTGPNGEGASLSMVYQNEDNTGPPSGRELGFWQVYAWDGTQRAPTAFPPAIVMMATENWSGTSHGCSIVFQTVPVGSAQANNNVYIGAGISIGTSTDPGVGGTIQTGKQTLLSGIPLNATATAAILMSSLTGFGVYCGTGIPSVAAGTGSLYLRGDGSTATTRMYVNQNGSTAWTAVTTQA